MKKKMLTRVVAVLSAKLLCVAAFGSVPARDAAYEKPPLVGDGVYCEDCRNVNKAEGDLVDFVNAGEVKDLVRR